MTALITDPHTATMALIDLGHRVDELAQAMSADLWCSTGLVLPVGDAGLALINPAEGDVLGAQDIRAILGDGLVVLAEVRRPWESGYMEIGRDWTVLTLVQGGAVNPLASLLAGRTVYGTAVLAPAR